MAKKSGKPGKGRGFKIKEEEPTLTPLDLEKDKLGSPTEGVSISLKYYREETECFSDWQSGELKKFSATIKKVGQLEAAVLKGHKPLCVPHKYDPAEARFARPAKLSEDLKFFEIKVDPSNKARIHGVFVGSVFFLVWLDRLHAVYPEN
jgi:hypothetical protein